MSNQRPGKFEKKLDRNGDMQVYKFFKTAAKLLNAEAVRRKLKFLFDSFSIFRFSYHLICAHLE